MAKYPTVLEIVSAPGAIRTSSQAIRWNYETWRLWLGPLTSTRYSWSGALDDLLAAGAGGDGMIRRSAVVDFGRDDHRRLFLAAMVWGYGTNGRGPWRVAKMLETSGVEGIIEEIVVTVRDEGAAAGYDKLWHSNRPRIQRLGPSFGTKLLYFAGAGYNLSPRPLIYDNVIAGKLAILEPSRRWPTDSQRLTTRQYEQYCRWAEGIGGACGVEADEVECALFNWSPVYT